MSKNLSAIYYPENKESLLKRARKRYQHVATEEKEQVTIWQ